MNDQTKIEWIKTIRVFIVALLGGFAIVVASYAYYEANRYEMHNMLRIDKYNNTVTPTEFKGE